MTGQEDRRFRGKDRQLTEDRGNGKTAEEEPGRRRENSRGAWGGKRADAEAGPLLKDLDERKGGTSTGRGNDGGKPLSGKRLILPSWKGQWKRAPSHKGLELGSPQPLDGELGSRDIAMTRAAGPSQARP